MIGTERTTAVEVAIFGCSPESDIWTPINLGRYSSRSASELRRVNLSFTWPQVLVTSAFGLRHWRRQLLFAAAAVVLVMSCFSGAAIAHGAARSEGLIAGSPPASAYPTVGRGTHFLNHRALVKGMSQPGWYLANVPFLQVPDKRIQNVYYYRWRVWKEHIRTLQPGRGPVLTEFLPTVSWAGPNNTIDDSAGHHIMEGRWVRNTRYVTGDIRYWLLGGGQRPMPCAKKKKRRRAVQYICSQTWVDSFSNWIIAAAWQRALVTGQTHWLKHHLHAVVNQYESWSSHYDSATGLYWQRPVASGMEFSAAAAASSNKFAGVPTLRPAINSYQYAAAKVISRIAALDGNRHEAERFGKKALELKRKVQSLLWSPKLKFFTDVLLPHNPKHHRLQARQEIGFVPWYFELPSPRYSVAWKQLMDPKGFFTSYGPTTLEVRTDLYMHNAYKPSVYDGNCCHWDGPSWPYATAQTLTALANLLDDYPSQQYVTRRDYDKLLHIYAVTQYKNGHPYVAEAHAPSKPLWIYDQPDHSEDYSHSTFNDLVISGLIGLRPRSGNSLVVQPLVPRSWAYFCLEDVPYHGHNITVLYDRSGKHYHQGKGLHVYVDGRLVGSQSTLKPLRVDLPLRSGRGGAQRVFMDDAVNVLGNGYPRPFSSYAQRELGHDSMWNGLDGNIWYDSIPEVNTRWTNLKSPNSSDDYGVSFGARIPLDEVRYYSFCNGRTVVAAKSFKLQYWTGSGWASVPHQKRDSKEPICNGLNRITFPQVSTSRMRLVLTDQRGHYVGVTEFEAGSWASAAVYLRLGPADGRAVRVRPRASFVLHASLRNEVSKSEGHPQWHLILPAGWQAHRLPEGESDALGPNGKVNVRWRVTPSQDSTDRGFHAIWLYARLSGDGHPIFTHARVRVHVG